MGTLAGTMETMVPATRRDLPPVPRPASGRAAEAAAASGLDDSGQAFVARLRAAAPEFAAAGGAQHAVVREAVPPARHRRARCRVVLRYADGNERDLTFLGPAGHPGAGADLRFDAAIRRWLAAGQQREGGWIVPDDDAPDGAAVDVTAWLAED